MRGRPERDVATVPVVASFSRLARRFRGTDTLELAAEVAELKDLVHRINHNVVENQRLLTELMSVKDLVGELNHELRLGGESELPLLLGYLERLRLDADTAVAASQVIERQLAIIADRDV